MKDRLKFYARSFAKIDFCHSKTLISDELKEELEKLLIKHWKIDMEILGIDDFDKLIKLYREKLNE
jgi:hypothetical protein